MKFIQIQVKHCNLGGHQDWNIALKKPSFFR